MPTSFRCAGATGQAPTTSFFGAIPDRLNGLIPAHATTALGGTAQIDFQTAANNVNQWTIFNRSFTGGANQNTISLGATTTAPDGTNTAQKIIPDTVSSQHYLTAILNDSPFGPSDMRLAVFAKAAEYTRIVLAIGAVPYVSGGSQSGVRTVFDLANGVVAVPGVVQGFGVTGQWVSIADTILPFGNGWYLCMIDVNIINGTLTLPNHFQSLSFVYVDNGSGAAAESTTFAGTGTSGVYTWRSCQLPIGAWGMAGQPILFDDFNDPTLANFDLTNSHAPGFTWYLDSIWPTGIASVPTNPSVLSASGSILTIFNANVFNLVFSSATWDRGTSYVGTIFQMQPMLIESRLRWDNICFSGGSGARLSSTSVWGTAISSLLLTITVPTSITNGTYFETDMLEIPPGAGQQFQPAFTLEPGPDFLKGSNNIGYTVWISDYNYTATQIVGFNGNLYTSLINSNHNNQPDISPAAWRLYVPADGLGGDPLPANIVEIDWSVFHTVSFLWLPNTPTTVGHFLSFVDGVLSQPNFFQQAPGHTPYSPDQGRQPGVNSGALPFREISIMDQQQFPLFITGGNNYHTYYDWIKLSR